MPKSTGDSRPSTTPCAGCGAKLEFAPGQAALKCPYCGAQNAIEQAADALVEAALEELDYAAYLARQAGNEPMIEQQTVNCPGCGAASRFAANIAADRCAFCAAPLVAANAYVRRIIRPRAVAPFVVEERAAKTRFRDWIGGLWFAPNALREACQATSGLKGIYLPYWTFDAQSATVYQGERGEHYLVSEEIVENGIGKTRQVQRTRWSPAGGEVQLAFDDVIVPATSSLPANYLENLEPWRLEHLQPYRDDYLAGFTVEAYQVGLEPGFKVATAHMENAIRNAIAHAIGGDEQRIHSMSPRYADIRFKHVLLPVWLSTYQYAGKTWRFLVNGQTGEVQGERPWSAWKIAGAVAAAIIVLLVVLALTSGGG